MFKSLSVHFFHIFGPIGLQSSYIGRGSADTLQLHRNVGHVWSGDYLAQFCRTPGWYGERTIALDAACFPRKNRTAAASCSIHPIWWDNILRAMTTVFWATRWHKTPAVVRLRTPAVHGTFLFDFDSVEKDRSHFWRGLWACHFRSICSGPFLETIAWPATPTCLQPLQPFLYPAESHEACTCWDHPSIWICIGWVSRSLARGTFERTWR